MAKKTLEKENQKKDPLHHLVWAATQIAQLEKEEKTGRKTAGKKPQYKVWRKDTKKTRRDRSKRDIDRYCY